MYAARECYRASNKVGLACRAGLESQSPARQAGPTKELRKEELHSRRLASRKEIGYARNPDDLQCFGLRAMTHREESG